MAESGGGDIGASIAGGLIGGLGSYIGAKYTADRQQAAADQAWQRQQELRQQDIQLQNTAHQREVEDLRKAGLNPILSALGGGGAGSPSTPSAPVANVPDMTAAGGALGNNVQNVVQMINQLRQTDAQIRAADAQSAKAASEVVYTNALTDNLPSAKFKAEQEAELTKLRQRLAGIELSEREAALPGKQLEGKMAGSPGWRAWEEFKGGLKGLAHTLTFGLAFKGLNTAKPQSSLNNYGGGY